MTSPSLWSRLKNAHMFRVLAIYLAASWLVLQVVGLFIETMGLPRWTKGVGCGWVNEPRVEIVFATDLRRTIRS